MMKRSAAPVAIGLLLVVTGGALWLRGRETDRAAQALRAFATLQYSRAMQAEATAQAARYWSGDYASVDAAADPLLAANAAYRAAVARGGPAKEVVTRLDEVAKRYAEVLRADPSNEHAAFNYEFVVRYRAAVAARGVSVPPAEETGTTPHGRVGAPARGTSQQQFKMLVPMRPEERREAEEAGKAGRRLRKG